MRIAVGVASAGRPEVLKTVLQRLKQQQRPADRTIISVSSQQDFADAEQLRQDGVEIIIGTRWLTRQRNALLDVAGDCDLIAFFDDDFVPCDAYLAEAERLFASRPDVALATGEVLADGIGGPGLAFSTAFSILREDYLGDRDAPGLRPAYNGYGCNMVARLAPILQHDIRFDEQLPLYGWLEDVDFSRCVARHGLIVHSSRMRGVHLGVKRGRQRGVQLGYSQIANPFYLALKRTMRGDRALWLMGRNLVMNMALSFRPEPYIDRRGRLIGNLFGLMDLLALRLHPKRAMNW